MASFNCRATFGSLRGASLRGASFRGETSLRGVISLRDVFSLRGLGCEICSICRVIESSRW
jgi:hypothetical protein